MQRICVTITHHRSHVFVFYAFFVFFFLSYVRSALLNGFRLLFITYTFPLVFPFGWNFFLFFRAQRFFCCFFLWVFFILFIVCSISKFKWTIISIQMYKCAFKTWSVAYATAYDFIFDWSSHWAMMGIRVWLRWLNISFNI